jgi:transcriptional regulator with XRE-family HTH domain
MNDETSNSQGAAYRERREEMGLSQPDLAERIGVSPRTIWAIENAGHVARSGTMARLRAELGLVGDEEVTRGRWPTHIAVVTAAVADLLTSLPEGERHEWASDLTMRVINDDVRITGRGDWPADVQVIADMVGAYLTRND